MTLHTTTRRSFVSTAVAGAGLVAGTGLAAAGGHLQNFRAHLSGDEEVPPVDTDAQGQALFKFDRTATELDYKLIVANIEDVVAAHIHCGARGDNGPVGVTLFSGGPVSPDGVLAEATVTAPDEDNACGWGDLAAVRDAIVAGNAYVNVHTVANPPGEIRGQIH